MDMAERECAGQDCYKCICSTCMHQGFDCTCKEENEGFISECEDYDEMTGVQMRLDI
ncbi:MAG: hypothetical protein K6D96_09825 [Acetatifactor sp.]|nr:hypothetical protein [Acetatifactor sp.]